MSIKQRKSTDSFDTESTLSVDGTEYRFYSLQKLADQGLVELSKLPFSIRVLLENALRMEDGYTVQKTDVEKLFKWRETTGQDICYYPARVILQDFTGVPCVVDLADMRDAMEEENDDPSKINPVVPVDLVIDHSIQVDHYGIKEAFRLNTQIEIERNRERYSLLKWAQKNLDNFRAVPPGAGIVHQVNLEFFAQVVQEREFEGGGKILLPDSLIGTDSHTTMINGIGVFGFGVGGIEAEAVMLGQPYNMVVPEVVGMKLKGSLPEGATATDLVLRVTEILRAEGVVNKIVEYFGPGLDNLSVPDRATLSNMSPEYGATMGFFPVDNRTLEYLELTNRGELVERVKSYCQAQGLFRQKDSHPEFTKVLELDMASIKPSVAGPKRPQDRVELSGIKEKFKDTLTNEPGHDGFGVEEGDLDRKVHVKDNGTEYDLEHGSVIISAITSCTNTSNPSVMIGAGLLAKKAVEKGLEPKPWVKTSLAPGSQVVVEYLKAAGLMDYLEQARFNLVGFGCTTCIGNSGPLKESIHNALEGSELVATSVLSGNRNFEGRIHPFSKANYLASPPLVVLYAFLGKIDVDLENDPIGTDKEGNPVYAKDVWPSQQEVADAVSKVSPEMFKDRYSEVFEGEEKWNALEVGEAKLYPWDPESTYIKRPPYFEDFSTEIPPLEDIKRARVLALLGHTTTTDHISPAGTIPKDMPAGQYLMEHGVEPKDFNSYGSRRGNHEVMVRGTFGNIRLRNLLVPGTEGGYTVHFPEKEKMTIYEAAQKYMADDIPTIVIGGKEYGTGSSRDWAAKGTLLLGVKAVIAESYERIHRNNLIGMGVLPLEFKAGEGRESLELTGEETYDITLGDKLTPGQEIPVVAIRPDGSTLEFTVNCRLDTQVEVDYYRHGGILPYVQRQLLND